MWSCSPCLLILCEGITRKKSPHDRARLRPWESQHGHLFLSSRRKDWVHCHIATLYSRDTMRASGNMDENGLIWHDRAPLVSSHCWTGFLQWGEFGSRSGICRAPLKHLLVESSCFQPANMFKYALRWHDIFMQYIMNHDTPITGVCGQETQNMPWFPASIALDLSSSWGLFALGAYYQNIFQQYNLVQSVQARLVNEVEISWYHHILSPMSTIDSKSWRLPSAVCGFGEADAAPRNLIIGQAIAKQTQPVSCASACISHFIWFDMYVG